MRTDTLQPGRGVAALTGSFVLLLAGVFVVPYFFPTSSLMLSASALAGFNNSLAYGWYVLAVIVAALAVARHVKDRPARAPLDADRPFFGAPPAAVVLIMAGHAALFGALYWVRRGFVFAEALYFQDATYRVVAGAVPFVDFNFFYGPLLLHPAVLLSRYIGVPAGYATAYVLTYLGGLYLLYVVLAAMMHERRSLIAWFALFAIGLFNPILGLNYTFGRFLLPIATIFAIWRCDRQASFRRCFVAAGLLFLAVLCSPDMAVVTVAGASVLTAVSLALHRAEGDWIRRLARSGTILLAGLTASAAVLLLIDGTWRPVEAYFRPIVTFSAGGWNTPIDPSLPMLTLIGLTVLVVAQWGRSFWSGCSVGAQPLLAAFVAISLMMQRAGFGKADVLHIAYSGLPVFLAAAAWTSWKPDASRGARWVAAALLLGIVGPLQFYDAMQFLPSIAQRLGMSSTISGPLESARSSSTKGAIQESIAKAVEQFGPDGLYYMHRLEYYRLPIYLRYQLKPFLYHPSLTSAFTARDIQDVIEALQKSDAIVLARRADLTVRATQPLDTHWWYFVTSAPLPGSDVYNLTLEFQAKLEAPLVQFLTSAYDQRFEDGEIVGLQPRRQHTP